jgi:hypothetical protein
MGSVDGSAVVLSISSREPQLFIHVLVSVVGFRIELVKLNVANTKRQDFIVCLVKNFVF